MSNNQNAQVTNEQLFWLAHTWKLEPEQIAQLSRHRLTKVRASYLRECLAASANGNLIDGFVPIYQYCTKKEIKVGNPDKEYWMSERVLGTLRIAILQPVREPK